MSSEHPNLRPTPIYSLPATHYSLLQMLLLRLLFVAILGCMLAVTGWASGQCALFAIPRDVFTHPWFIATLFDAYWAFVTFTVWVIWKEQSLGARILWFIAVILWGNIAMSLYMLVELFRIKTIDQLGEVFSTRRPGKIAFPAVLTALGLAIYLLGAKSLFTA